jgi:hypothetical protein
MALIQVSELYIICPDIYNAEHSRTVSIPLGRFLEHWTPMINFFSRLTDGYQVLIHTEKTNVCDGIKDASPVEVLRVSTADGSFYEPWGLDGFTFTSGFDWNSCSPQVLLKPNFHQDTWLRRSWADSAVDSPFRNPSGRQGRCCAANFCRDMWGWAKY